MCIIIYTNAHGLSSDSTDQFGRSNAQLSGIASVLVEVVLSCCPPRTVVHWLLLRKVVQLFTLWICQGHGAATRNILREVVKHKIWKCETKISDLESLRVAFSFSFVQQVLTLKLFVKHWFICSKNSFDGFRGNSKSTPYSHKAEEGGWILWAAILVIRRGNRPLERPWWLTLEVAGGM